MTQHQLFGDSDGWAEEDYKFPPSPPHGGEFWREQAIQPRLANGLVEERFDSQPLPNAEPEPRRFDVDAESGGQDQVEEPERIQLTYEAGTTSDAGAYSEWIQTEPDSEAVWRPNSTDEDLLDLTPDHGQYQDFLARPAFVVSEDGQDIDRALRVDQFLSNIPNLDGTDLERSRNLLLSLKPARFGSWLAWLLDRNWEPQRLLAFLEFQRYWDSQWTLWECGRIDSNSNWHVWHDRNSMTRENALAVVGNRLSFPTDQIIDPAWWSEWNQINISILDPRQYYSFASYVLYKVTVTFPGGPLISSDLAAPEYEDVLGERKWPSLSEFGLAHGLSVPDYWRNQEWYTDDDWHDGQGH